LLFTDPEKTGDEEGERQTGPDGSRLDLLDLEAARQLILQLQASLEARERQLERKMEEVANMQDATQQVMVEPMTICICMQASDSLSSERVC
jgi:capsid protein